MTTDGASPSSREAPHLNRIRTKALRQIIHTIGPGESDPLVYEQVVDLCHELRRLGAEPRVGVVQARIEPTESGLVAAFPRGPGPRWLNGSSRLHQWMRSSAGSGDCGMLHSHGLWSMPCVYPGWVARWNWTPYIASIRGMLAAEVVEHQSRLARTFWLMVQRPALASATCFHVDSSRELVHLERCGLVKPTAIIPTPATQGNARTVLQSGDVAREIVWIGSSTSSVIFRKVLEAWSALGQAASAWRLRIVASQTDQPMVDLPASASIEIARGEPLVELLANSAACIVDLQDRHAHIIDEAMAAGVLPLVITGPERTRQAEPSGCVVARDDVESIARACLYVIESSAESRIEFGEACRRESVGACSVPGIARRVLQMYEWVISGMPDEERPYWIWSPGAEVGVRREDQH